jgi:melibiose permease/lactose/raffinose/galactose permease
MFAASFVIFFFTPISRKVSRKRLVRAGLSMAAIGYLLMLIFGLFWPPAFAEYKFYALAGANMLIGFENVLYLVLLVTIANCVEYNEYKHGQRNEGIIFSVRAFVSKLGMAFGQLLSMLIYLIVGVIGFTNQISDIENAAVRGEILMDAKTEQIEAVIRGVSVNNTNALLCFLTLVPLVCVIVAAIIYSKKIILDEERYEEIIQTLAARNDAKTMGADGA